MGPGFCGTNKTSRKVHMEQINIGGHRLCNQMGGGQSVKDKYYNNNNKVSICVHSY
jgi:hypothetical protein